MRASLVASVIVAALLVAAPIRAQTKKDKETPAAASTSRAILAKLQVQVKVDKFAPQMKFADLLELARDELQGTVTFLVDEEAYREENAEAVLDMEIRLRNLPARTTVNQLLRHALRQFPVKSAFVVRAGRVDIVPLARTSKDVMLNQTFHVDFSERRLDAALEELSELTGVSILLDGRAKQKAQATVTARFNDDVALQDAVRMLSDMAELKMVYLVTGIYLTTPEHAAVLQKELKLIYEGPACSPVSVGLMGLGGIGGMGGIGPVPPSESPLAPPLPPARKRLDGGAAQ